MHSPLIKRRGVPSNPAVASNAIPVATASCLALIFITGMHAYYRWQSPSITSIKTILFPSSSRDAVWSDSVYMTRREQTLLVTFLNTSQTMVEWGSWGSPQHYSKFVGKYFSIEYNTEWYRQHEQEMARLGVHYHLQPVEPYHKGWMGKFWAPGNYDQFYEYVNAVEALPGLSKIDRVFIDGRARVACAVRALPYLHHDSVVFIHGYGPPQDWRWERRYDQVERYYTLIGLVDSMAVLKPKQEFLGPDAWKNINITALYDEWYTVWWELPDEGRMSLPHSSKGVDTKGIPSAITRSMRL